MGGIRKTTAAMKAGLLLAAACLLGTAFAADYKCTKSANFILGLPYSQRSLTDACKGGVCDANPIYGEKNCPKKAMKWCEAECTKQSNPSCVGFFFQKHQNGHEICGFYHGVCPKKTMHAPTVRWVHHNHKNGAVCELVPPHKKSPTTFPTPSKESRKVHLVQGTVQFATALAQTASGKKIFDLAFRAFVASSAGHVCGTGEACAPNDVVITSFRGVSVTFRMRVANGQLATAAVANIKTRLEDGTVFAASLAAAGVTDMATLKKLVLGDKTSFEVKVEEPAVHEKHHYSRSARSLRLFRCPKFLAMVGGVLALVLLAIAFLRYVRRPLHIQLQEVPEEVVVVTTIKGETAKYEIVKGDLNKDQV